MQDYTIDVRQIEALQTIENTAELDRIFSLAKSAIVNGARVLLVRTDGKGGSAKFDEMDTLETLAAYRRQVFKYL